MTVEAWPGPASSSLRPPDVQLPFAGIDFWRDFLPGGFGHKTQRVPRKLLTLLSRTVVEEFEYSLKSFAVSTSHLVEVGLLHDMEERSWYVQYMALGLLCRVETNDDRPVA